MGIRGKIKLSLILVIVCLQTSHAYEFQNFKVKAPQQSRSAMRKQLSEVNEESPLFRQIRGILTDYQQIGDSQSGPLILDRNIGGGVQNFSGFAWNKPEANFSLYANRQLAPNLFDDNWIVHDRLTIEIHADTLLSNMAKDGTVEVSDEIIGAFAGISFIRTYDYYHFADTYVDGLQQDYSKLFLTFTKLNAGHLLNLEPNVVIKREDNYTFNAGGVISSPISGGLSLGAGVLIDAAFKNNITIQSVAAEEFLRMTVDKSYTVGAAAELSLQLDFFNLLKISLLQYELSYEYTDTSGLAVNFYDKFRIQENSELREEFNALVKGRIKSLNNFKENQVSLNERRQEDLSHKFSFLLFGNTRKSNTERIVIETNDKKHLFYKHYNESKKYVQSFLSKIFNSIMSKLFDVSSGVKNAAKSEKKISIEYEYKSELGENKVQNSEDFSLKISKTFETAKTHRWNHRIYKKEALKELAKWTTIPIDVLRLVDKDKLRGPLSISTNINLNSSSLEYFFSRSTKDIFESFMNVCRVKKRKWSNIKKHSRYLRRIQIGRQSCVKKLAKGYYQMKDRFIHQEYFDIDAMRKMTTYYLKKARHLKDITDLFGSDQSFISGKFDATKDNGQTFTTHFKSGQFTGLGVIDSFVRGSQATIPIGKN